MPVAQTQNQQVIEAVVGGPDAANRLFTCTGQAAVDIFLSPGQTALQTLTFLVGPALPRPQFHRATATVAVAGYALYAQDPTANGWHSLAFESVEADWDDESGSTEVRVEVAMNTGPGIAMRFSKVGFSATVLAEIPGA